MIKLIVFGVLLILAGVMSICMGIHLHYFRLSLGLK